MYVRFSQLEFKCIDGKIRTFYGCSVVGAIEFEERLQELKRQLSEMPEHLSTYQAYQSDDYIRHLVNRLLELNGIKPEWCNWDMITQFLFGRDIDGKVSEGYLITLNKPDKSSNQKASPLSGKYDPKILLLASIATHCQSLEEVYRLANSVPARDLLGVLAAKNDLSKSEKELAKEEKDSKYKSWVEMRKKAYQQRQGAE